MPYDEDFKHEYKPVSKYIAVEFKKDGYNLYLGGYRNLNENNEVLVSDPKDVLIPEGYYLDDEDGLDLLDGEVAQLGIWSLQTGKFEKVQNYKKIINTSVGDVDVIIWDFPSIWDNGYITDSSLEVMGSIDDRWWALMPIFDAFASTEKGENKLTLHKGPDDDFFYTFYSYDNIFVDKDGVVWTVIRYYYHRVLYKWEGRYSKGKKVFKSENILIIGSTTGDLVYVYSSDGENYIINYEGKKESLMAPFYSYYGGEQTTFAKIKNADNTVSYLLKNSSYKNKTYVIKIGDKAWKEKKLKAIASNSSTPAILEDEFYKIGGDINKYMQIVMPEVRNWTKINGQFVDEKVRDSDLWQNGRLYPAWEEQKDGTINSLLADTATYSGCELYEINNNGLILARVKRTKDEDDKPIPEKNQWRSALLLPIDFKLLWETSNKANQIFNKTRKDDPNDSGIQEKEDDATYGIHRNKLYVVTLDGDSYKVSAEIHTGGNDDIRKKMRIAAYKDDKKLDDSDTKFSASDTDQIDMTFKDTGDGETDYELKMGYDANDNDKLDDDEANRIEVYQYEGKPKYLYVRGFNNKRYKKADDKIKDIVEGNGLINGIGQHLVRNAQAFLNLFYNSDINEILEKYRPTTLSPASLDVFKSPGDFCEWLTHNSGAGFDETGKAPSKIQRYYWNEKSDIAGKVATTSPLYQLRNNSEIRQKMQSETAQVVDNYKDSSVPMGEVFESQWYSLQAIFDKLGKPHYSPNWVPKQTLLIGKDTFPPGDAYSALARSRFTNANYRFIVKKEMKLKDTTPEMEKPTFVSTPAIVTYIKIIGKSKDLYDFNVETSEPGISAAIVQIGFGNGSNGRDKGKNLSIRNSNRT